MMNDIIADALTRIRNAAMRKLEVATLLHSNTVVGILDVLQQKEYIDSYKVIDGEKNKKTVQVTLKYDDNDNSVINELTRVSKPGRRVYRPSSELKSFKTDTVLLLFLQTKVSLLMMKLSLLMLVVKYCVLYGRRV